MVVGFLDAFIGHSTEHHVGCEDCVDHSWHAPRQLTLRQRQVTAFLDNPDSLSKGPKESSEDTIARLQGQLKKVREDIRVEAAGKGKPSTNPAYVADSKKLDEQPSAASKDAPQHGEVAPSESLKQNSQSIKLDAKPESPQVASDDGPDAPVSDAAKAAGVSNVPPTPGRRASIDKQKPRSVGQCTSADGRYTVKVTPDGVRRLYDTSVPGMILTRIQCDGDAPKGDYDNCNSVSWPCPNMRRPFPGYIEEITDKIKPLCQVPGWHALFVGLGGGYMQTNFAKLCAADARLDTIENAPGVVPVAKNTFGFNPRDPKQHLEFGDVLPAMKDHASAGDKYDFIFTDYKSASSKAFLNSAHDLLKPSGRLAFSKTGEEYKEDWLDALKDYFTPAKVTKTAEGNFTLMATPKVLSNAVQPVPQATQESAAPSVQDILPKTQEKNPTPAVQEVEAKEAVLKAQEIQ
mmetsp:Transcript_57539/g.89552  ORF Transcript_57539/g.89552 Transcript_57539/m.89552 type:complete len:461 (-) Transcript_57539:65-1447(-)